MEDWEVPFELFRKCIDAISSGIEITRESRSDKEFPFQNWIKDRLTETGIPYDVNGRNSYPDFTLVRNPIGFEVKGLTYPGREMNYDSNSQFPTGSYNSRTIYYVFGRYPKEPDGNSYPVYDLVICHGDFLNAQHEYAHKNKSVGGFGSYGDIHIRDRKMYVVPTPYKLSNDIKHKKTLIIPKGRLAKSFNGVGELVRTESDKILLGYDFDLTTNELTARMGKNPLAGTKHHFMACSLGKSNHKVSLAEGVQ